MAYKLNVTEYAEELLDNILYYLLFQLKSESTAKHLLDEIENIYVRLEENPFQFPICKDIYLAQKDYHEATVPQLSYIIIFDIRNDTVNVMGIFHQMENYQRKL